MDTETQTEEEKSSGKTAAEWQKHWTKEISAAVKRLKQFKHRGDKIVDRFLDEGRDKGAAAYESYSLNLFHSNVVTLQSMLYGSVPKVDVSREHHDPDDDVARVASLMYQRILQADVDPSGSDFPTVLKSCLQDRLLAGLGVARVRYEFEEEEVPVMGPEGPLIDEDGEPIVQSVVTEERAPVDYVHWGDFAWSWGRTWGELSWIGFKNYLTKEQAEARFSKEKTVNLTYKKQSPDADDADDTSGGQNENSVTQKAEIWEIWNMEDRRVYWFATGQTQILDERDDPLGLNGFWPVPKPMIANLTTKSVIPTADFVIAQDLYDQIDTLYTRITIITRAVKVVGVYDGAAKNSVGRMLGEGMENDLIPVDNWAMFAEGGGLRGKIDWFPVEQVVGTLQTLREVLQGQIQLLYQVSGMSDIMRGESQQYSGVGQEQMKAKFGSIRVQALQEEFARFASDLESLRAEVISKHFEPRTIAVQSSAEFLPQPDKPLIPQALQLMKSPAIKWRVDIKPESIAMVDYQNLKAERTEFIMAVAQYIQSAQGMAQAVPNSMPVLMEMLKWGIAGFKGANYLEGILDQAIDLAQQPQQGQGQQEPSPEQMKVQLEQLKQQGQQMKNQGELAKIQAKAAADSQALMAKMEGEMRKIQLDSSTDASLETQRFEARMREMMQEFNNDLAVIAQQLEADITVEEAQSSFAIMEENVDHENTMTQIAAQSRVRGV